jgi:hypothetical protein
MTDSVILLACTWVAAGMATWGALLIHDVAALLIAALT